MSKIFVATAYFCDESWPICVSLYEDLVRERAEEYVKTHPITATSHDGVEGYWICETELIE